MDQLRQRHKRCGYRGIWIRLSRAGWPFAEVSTIEEYTDSMMDLIAGPLPDASYEMKSFSVDEERGNVTGYAVFRATHTGEGGPVPPTGKAIETDCVYVMAFADGKILHLTKIWNDVWALRQGGWA